MYEEFKADLKAKGFGGLVKTLEDHDYKNGYTDQHHETTSIGKTKTVNTTSNTESKNERPAVGTGGPSSPIEVVN